MPSARSTALCSTTGRRRQRDMRQEFPKRVRLEAFRRADGHCERCGSFLVAGKFRLDHEIPDALGGKPTLDNCVVACIACDSEKTYKRDIPAIAKSKRIRAREAGIRKRSTFACSKQS